VDQILVVKYVQTGEYCRVVVFKISVFSWSKLRVVTFSPDPAISLSQLFFLFYKCARTLWPAVAAHLKSAAVFRPFANIATTTDISSSSTKPICICRNISRGFKKLV
jgi:hypothetical protein